MTRRRRRRGDLTQLRENLRLQQVYNVFWNYGLDMLLDRGMLGAFRRFMQQKLHGPAQPVARLSIPVKMRLMLQELGPTYIKMGQMVSSQANFLSSEWLAELTKLQSNVPPFPFEQAQQIIMNELGAPPETLFASFETTPLAAASTAQVHRATLTDGRRVVVKVQRPDIQHQVKADLAILDRAARVTQRRARWAKDMDLVGMLTEFENGIIVELDYLAEAYHAGRLGRNMQSLIGVQVPVIFRELSTSRVLTMEYVEGVKITDLTAIEAAGLDREALGERVLRSFVKQLIIDGFFHSDPHPGNVLVNLDTGIVYLIDLGLVGELDLTQRINLVNLLLVLQERDVEGLAQVALTLSTPFRKVDERAYYRDFNRQVSRYLDPDSIASFSEVMGVVFDLLLQHGYRLDSALTLAIKGLMQVEAIFSLLSPKLEIVATSFGIAIDLILNSASTENVTKAAEKQVLMSLREIIQRLPSLREATVKWLDQYQAGEFNLKLDTSDLNQELGNFRKISQQVILGVMLVGMIIGSAIATTSTVVSDRFGIFDLARVAYFGYILSMIIAAIAVLGLLTRLWRNDDD